MAFSREEINGDNVACIVDAYSSGAELARELKRTGWYLLHVQSAPTVPVQFVKHFDASLFDEHWLCADIGYASILDRLQQHRPAFLVAGSEPGVELADMLANALGLAGNSPQTSIRRRNRFFMAKALSDSGLETAKQYLVQSELELFQSLRQLGRYPVVVKPVDAMGSEQVHVCHGQPAALDAFNCIYGQRNRLGATNTGVLVQAFLEGDQYVVNAVSIGGRHRITEMWFERRLNIRGVGNLYDVETLIPYEGEVQARLIDYIRKVLTALGIEEGPSHSEVVLTPRGPVLIETGARLQGGVVSAPIIQAIGESHVTMTLKRYLDPVWFNEHIDKPYVISRVPRVVNLIMDRAGIVKENNCPSLLPSLPSFQMIVRTPGVGEHVPRTVDLCSKAGHIYLLHRSLEQLDRDYAQIRAWEKSGALIVLE